MRRLKPGYIIISLAILIVLYLSATKTLSANSDREFSERVLVSIEPNFDARLRKALDAARIPQNIMARILAGGAQFQADLRGALDEDPYLWILVDKQHALPAGYEPDDLVELVEGVYHLGNTHISLRRVAAESLAAMARAAKKDGIRLTASSAYRSEAYQAEVYARNVQETGQETADRESARPGHSQHQLGTVVDFGSISDAFAATDAGRWVLANAADFGWSLSFPNGLENLTGYRWESWHYRYVGHALVAFIDTWFDGIQQYALQFLHEWVNNT
ncbi:MAG: M15 family metallopeptidase [Treponema sp.]|jgi:D-alanyl-D-alanine carboxypeptidase|nr:M15 family metallopeptidase [Treponema sp.]